MTNEATTPTSDRIAYHIGFRYTEINTILRKIRYRPSGQPTFSEQNRIATLKHEIATLKQGGFCG